MTANPFQRDPVPTPKLLLTTRQAAEALQVCEKTVFNLTRSGQLRAVKIGSAVRYAVADIEAFIQSAKGGQNHDAD